jgi:hypothetical protein
VVSLGYKQAAVAVVAALAWALLSAPQAGATRVLVLDGGRVHARSDPAVPARDGSPLPRPRSTRPAGEEAPVRASASRSDPVKRAIRAALAAGQVSADDAARYRSFWTDARSTRKRLSGGRARELGSVIDTLAAIARQGRLVAPRMPALFLILERNREWWVAKGAPASGARVRFGATRLIFQYYPGQGLQVQPLANFGAANGYWYASNSKALRALVDELLAIRVVRGGFTAWEYYFRFGGGSPPWVSGMAQGTAVQALARAGTLLADPTLLSVAQTGLGAFEQRTPLGARVPAGTGAWYALYSFAPGLEVLNGMLQSLIGLHTYATLTGDARGMGLFGQGDETARARIGSYDTGAWSLYSRSGARAGAEANLNYHILNRDFARRLCKLTGSEPYCKAAENFTRYLSEDPKLDPAGPVPAPARAGRGVRFYFSLSKVGRVGITVSSQGKTYLSTSAGFSRGRRYFRWVPPRLRSERTYDYKLFARDLAGNTGTTTGNVRVKPAR